MTDKKRGLIMIAENAIVAAIYFVLTAFMAPISFGMIQARIGEILVLFAFWRPDFIVGLTLGCFLANIFSPMAIDMLFGTLATLISVVLVSYASPRLWVALIWPVLVNGVVVGLELFFFLDNTIPFIVQAGWVALGEFIVMGVGYGVLMILCRNKGFMRVMDPIRHKEVRF